MKIVELYRMLCYLYKPHIVVDIERYLLSCADDRSCTIVGNRALEREALIIRQGKDSIELGLYIAPEIIEAIDTHNPLDKLEALALAIEGVSHFLYVLDRLAMARRVSKLELELQAEVDKFLLIHILASRHSRSVSPELFERQFERHTYDPSLSEDERERYATASHFAAKYCAYLRESHFNPLNFEALSTNARDFFRRDLSSKLKLLIP